MTHDSALTAEDLAAGRTPRRGALRRTVYSGPRAHVTVVALAAGARLDERVAGLPAFAHVLSGRVAIDVSGRRHEAGPGTWVHVAAGAPHALAARTPATVLLTLLRRDEPARRRAARPAARRPVAATRWSAA